MFVRRYVYHILGWNNKQSVTSQENEKTTPTLNQVSEQSSDSSHTAIFSSLMTSKESAEKNLQEHVLSNYYQELSKILENLQITLKKLEQFKTNIVGDNEVLKKYANDFLSKDKLKVKENVTMGIRNFFHYLFENIKSDLQPETHELNHLLDICHQHMQVLFQDLNADCDTLENKTTSKEDKYKICLDIFRLNLDLINDLFKLIANVQTELQYCFDSGKVSQDAITYLVEITKQIILKVPLPSVEYDFNDFNHRLLSNDISTAVQKNVYLKENEVNFKVEDYPSKDQLTDLDMDKPIAAGSAKVKLSGSDSILFKDTRKKIITPQSSYPDHLLTNFSSNRI